MIGKKCFATFMVIMLIIVSCCLPLVPVTSSIQATSSELNENVAIEQIEEIPTSTEEIINEIINSEPEIDINTLPAEIIYTTTGVNLRSGPSTEDEIIDTLIINTQLDKIGINGDWTEVRVDGQKYYIYSKYTSTEKTKIVTTSRSSTQDRTQEIKSDPVEGQNGTFLGYYTLTYYCPCSKCCGSYANGITAWGTTAVAGQTVAVPTSIKLGTKLNIDGHIYTAEDRGGAIKGNKIDVYVDSHSEALAKGVTKNVPVWIWE